MIQAVDRLYFPVTDLARARAFYEGPLGLPAPRVEGDRATYDLGGEGPRLVLIGPGAQDALTPAGDAASLGLAKRDFPGAVAAMRGADALGMEPFETDGCHGGPSSDPDGNAVLVHQRKDEPAREGVADFVVVPVEDMARARAFYEGVLGLTLDSEGRGIWAEYVLPDGSALALFENPGGFDVADGGAVALRCSDVAGTYATLRDAGYARGEATADAAPVRDSEGNALLLVG